MTPAIALLVIGGILLVSGWKGGTIADAFMGNFPDRDDPPPPRPNRERGANAIPGVVGDRRDLQLPRRFTPTHDTGGLPGYPAIDVFADPGTRVLSPANGVVRRISGQEGGPGGGGPYGHSLYIKADDGADYFLTHFGDLVVRVGQRIKRGMVLGTVADYPDRADHIHQGIAE